MTDRQFECIKMLANLARHEGATRASVRRGMLNAGWTDEEIKSAIAALTEKSET
jgi:alkylhydroperoxidase/carboxymuconolactone decarboxylase family protein YurZ